MSQEQQQPTLDKVVIQGQVEELRKTVEGVKLVLEGLKTDLCELAERVARVEMNADVSQTGLDEIYRTLELHGLMKDGEATQGSKTEKEPIHESWNPEKIVWVDATGSKGPYQKSDDVNSHDFKAMLRDLQGHRGKLSRGGYFFWVFTNGAVIGRKKRGKQA